MESAHVAVVLAAGGSARLGTPKQLLRRDGETLLHRTVRIAAATQPRRVIVVMGAKHEAFAAELADLPHIRVVNENWKTGLAGSLRAAAPHVPIGRAALIVACDQPALSEQHLRVLLAGAHSASSGSAATLIGTVLGIPAVVPGEWFEELDADGDHGFRDRLRRLPTDAVFRLDAPELARDVDTPDNLRDAIAMGLLDASAAGSPAPAS
ncbi:MAG TPA: nucleotidyltransferase family protein [Lysobacter sp.]